MIKISIKTLVKKVVGPYSAFWGLTGYPEASYSTDRIVDFNEIEMKQFPLKTETLHYK